MKGGPKRVGAGLSLDKFAKAGLSKYDKRKVIQKQMALKAKQYNKYKRLKKRLEAAEPLHLYTLEEAAGEAAEEQQQSRQRHAAESSADEQHVSQQQQRPEARQSDKKRLRQQQQQPQQQQQQQQQQLDEAEEGQQEQQHSGKRPKPKPKPKSQLQRLAEKAAADKARQQQELLERERAIAEHKKQIEEKKKLRGHQKHDFFRKTKRGQPVMKYRVDKILAQLQQEKAAHS